jgi:hypothetical protein
MFVHVFDVALSAHYNAKSHFVLFKSFDDKRVDYEGDWNTEALTMFLNDNKMPLLSEFN